MNCIETFLLGFLQGLTEFLPVSSSGHLVVVETFLNGRASDYLFFDVLLHLATLLAVCIFFRKRLFRLGAVCLEWIAGKNPSDDSKTDRTMIAAILLSSLITGALGILFEEKFVMFRDRLDWVGGAFIVTGVLLFSTLWAREKKGRTDRFVPVNLWIFAVVMGLVQACAILPGISRSGVTVGVALLMGVSRTVAIEYSFLMSIPVILGAGILELRHAEAAIAPLPAVLGFSASLVSGVIFLGLLIRLVNAGRLYQFAFYTIPLGLWVIWYSL